jgi:DNA invertase Pin-like site-specific DNA recombinase
MSFKLVFVNDKGKRIGEGHHRAKLTDKDIDLVFELRDMGLSYSTIAGKFDDIPGGVSRSTVRKILKGQTRAQVPAATKRVLVRALELAFDPASPDEFPLCT